MGEANFYYFTCLNKGIRLKPSFPFQNSLFNSSHSPLNNQDGSRSAVHASQPQAVSQRPHGQAGDGQAQVGHGVQRLSRVRRRIHESPVGQHGGVHRRGVGGQLGRSSDPLQQRPLHPGRGRR